MNLLDAIKRDEGCVLKVYPDSLGIRTAGYGRNLEACGIDWPIGTPITQENTIQD
jgi:GH24 family phage-related lysozyme (muramidase)